MVEAVVFTALYCLALIALNYGPNFSLIRSSTWSINVKYCSMYLQEFIWISTIPEIFPEAIPFLYAISFTAVDLFKVALNVLIKTLFSDSQQWLRTVWENILIDKSISDSSQVSSSYCKLSLVKPYYIFRNYILQLLSYYLGRAG